MLTPIITVMFWGTKRKSSILTGTDAWPFALRGCPAARREIRRVRARREGGADDFLMCMKMHLVDSLHARDIIEVLVVAIDFSYTQPLHLRRYNEVIPKRPR